MSPLPAPPPEALTLELLARMREGHSDAAGEIYRRDHAELLFLAVAADGNDDGGVPGSDRGAVYVLFLKGDGTVKGHTKISATSGGFGGGLLPSAYFGSALARVGDLDGDGKT